MGWGHSLSLLGRTHRRENKKIPFYTVNWRKMAKIAVFYKKTTCKTRKIYKIPICGQNLPSEHLKLHIWLVWVGTQLKELLSGVPDALWVRYFDLSMKNEPNCHIIMVQGDQKSQNPHLWTKSSLWTLETSHMVNLGGYRTETIAFSCSRCFMGQICGSKHSKWAKL